MKTGVQCMENYKLEKIKFKKMKRGLAAPAYNRYMTSIGSTQVDLSSMAGKSPVFIKIVGTFTPGNEMIEKEPIPYYVSSSVVTALAKVDTADQFKEYLSNKGLNLKLDNAQFPVYACGTKGSTIVAITDEESFIRLTQGTNRYWEEIIHLLKYSPLLGSEVEIAKEHFEETK